MPEPSTPLPTEPDWHQACVLITGGARRLGRMLAVALAQRGAAIALHYHRSHREAEQLARELEGSARRVWLFRANLAEPAEQDRLAARVLAECHDLCGVVNNASLYQRTPLADLTRQEWDEHIAVNLSAPVWLAVLLGRAMRQRQGGSIVQVGDWSVAQPYRDYLPYTVSKGALATATRALARELAPEVRVNMVALGPMLLPEGSNPDLEARIARAVPMNRVGTPQEYVAAVLYLLAGGTYCTGSVLTVDGGRSLA